MKSLSLILFILSLNAFYLPEKDISTRIIESTITEDLSGNEQLQLGLDGSSDKKIYVPTIIFSVKQDFIHFGIKIFSGLKKSLILLGFIGARGPPL